MGIFWTASVHPWNGHSTDPSIELGPYSEAIRKWLQGESSFPQNVVLSTIVSPPLKAQILFNNPCKGAKHPWRSYYVHVPGILFLMDVGKQISPEMKWL